MEIKVICEKIINKSNIGLFGKYVICFVTLVQ